MKRIVSAILLVTCFLLLVGCSKQQAEEPNETDCVREHQVMAENMLFQNSFRLGARIMLEVMRE